MTDPLPPLPEGVSVQALLGYLNFAEGRPDPRFQKQLNDVYAACADADERAPWEALLHTLRAHLRHLHAEGSAAFRDVTQAEAVLRLAFEAVLPAYRAHHRDLLAHQTNAALWQPFFLARVCEAVLSQRGPWDETERIVTGGLRQLNDFVGHRPVAVLETRQRGEPYAHERVRPVPLFLRGAGVACGRYHDLLVRALHVLETTDPALCAEACFDPALLDEFAFDPRGYDFAHPADKRPNYAFGEWDPHHLDGQARYRRFVVRQLLLDGLLERVETTPDLPCDELLTEAAAVLAGAVLMAAGVSGAGPQTYDSTTNLSSLVPRIARYRDAFYVGLLDQVGGSHGERLRREAETLRQPLGGARQHLNQFFARQRALQMQKRLLALLLARLGYPAASRRQAAHLAPASARLLTEMHLLLTTAELRIDLDQLDRAAEQLSRVEDLLKRGIDCGALADPWNVLGFQGLFPRFQSMEDSVRDTRIDELIQVVERTFRVSTRLLGEAAARGIALPGDPAADVRRLATWWDHFATTSVADVPHVRGAEAARSAERLAAALTEWRARGAAAADLAFWRGQHEHLATPEAFALVIAALLEKRDFRAAMALLMTWIGRAGEVPLAEGEHSFHDLALRWMLAVCRTVIEEPDTTRRDEALTLIGKFFDYLEANAEVWWEVPRLDPLEIGTPAAPAPAADDDATYDAAYEEMTYQDSTDDDVEAEVLDVMPQQDFDLAAEAERLEPRLNFLATVARLWGVAARAARGANGPAVGWFAQARANHGQLLQLLDAIHAHPIPRPSGSFESMVEYDRRRVIKERLTGQLIATCLEHALAVGALQGATAQTGPGLQGAAWEPILQELEQAVLARDAERTRTLLTAFGAAFQGEPLLVTPLAQGGSPRLILRAALAQTVLRALAVSLPRLGLLRETYELLKLTRAMEAAQPLAGPRATEFDRLYQLGLQAVVEAVADAARRERIEPDRLVEALSTLARPFLEIWQEHSMALRVSALEILGSDADWHRLVHFVQTYGRDLFTPRFLALANLRAVLHRGAGAYLDHLRKAALEGEAMRLGEDLGRGIDRADAERLLTVLVQALIEGYAHYLDYDRTTAQSDDGANLHQLLDFLRLRASYERTAWRLRPLNLIHEVLARHDGAAAALWRDQVQQFTRWPAQQHLQELARLEKKHGIRLATVRDRIEEHFVRPMALDRLCALVEPALRQAREHLDRDESTPLEEELRPYADTPTGAGLEAPAWLARLEHELQRARAAQSAVAHLAEGLFSIPRLEVPFAQLIHSLSDNTK